jgi:RNA polymerase subunit RPABC4/transcription elongation factor Spt4
VSDIGAEQRGDVYEMLWDCRFCGTTKLLGKTHRFCPACGSPQDPSWRYYPADDEKIAVKDHVYVGADKTCASCGTLNAANAEFCPRCGAPQTEAAQVKQLGMRSAEKDQKLDREDLTARQDAEAAILVSGIAQTAPKKSSGFKLWHLGLVAVVLAVIGGGLFVVFSTRESSVYVSDFRWERSIDVEEMRAVSDSSVCSSMPGDAYDVDRRREQVDTRRVADGETCRRVQVDQGDGTFREQQQCETKYREEAVYGDVCYYTVDRWDFDRTVESEGDKDTEPFWEDLNLRRTGSCLGCEREVDDSRKESYILVLTGDGGTEYECAVEYEVWDSAELESTWKLSIGSVMGDARCDTLAPTG